MGLIGKLQAETLIKAPADQFHEVFGSGPHHVPNICPDKIHKVDLHEGDWGNPGSVTEWSYTLDVANKSVSFSLIEGELMEEYKSLKVVMQMIPKGNDTWMHLTIDYEKLHKDIPAPVHILGLYFPSAGTLMITLSQHKHPRQILVRQCCVRIV